MRLYRNESSDPKTNAQRNLCGRTHYVDDDTLHWHKSRVLLARDYDRGLLFAIVTSDALDMQNTTRGFRYVIFDVFGTVLGRPDLEHAYRTRKKAAEAMHQALNAIDVKAHTWQAINKARRDYAQEMDELTALVDRVPDVIRTRDETAVA